MQFVFSTLISCGKHHSNHLQEQAKMGDEEISAPPSDAEQKLYALNALQVVGGWSVHDDGDGRIFYYDHKTDSSQWEVPDDLASLETEFMMKLMLQNAVARSGVWTAHDTGNGTLYYFNSKTRESVWERPSRWGEEEAAAVAERAREEEEQHKAAKKEKKEKKKHRKHKKHKEERDDEAEQKEVEAKDEEPAQEVEEEVPLTEEELQSEVERKAREQKRIEQFRAMLRDKNIMPLTKWSVALPQIAGDPRFMGVPTMDERRAIFEHFVAHRRDDLKAEKKSKLKQAKKLFTELLREQFQLNSWEPNTTLSVFLSTLENYLDAQRYKQIQDDALVLLTLSAQEKIYAKAVADYKSEALKRDGEQLRLTRFLEEKLSTQDKTTMKWESDEVQNLVRDFYSSAASSGESTALLSEQQQKQVFEEIVLRSTRDHDLTRDEDDRKQPERSDPRRRSPSHSSEHKHRGSSPRESRHAYHDRHESRRRRSRSDSRSQSRGRERSHRSRRSSRRRSVSLSRSRSRSRSREERSSRRSSRHHRHRSSSSSRSRSRTRR
ncbi:hypothetical protein F442_07884 [Phytophthora nicotianae P10297]|uniref:WW domain-containing protein n=4 Tax=Phytophthora nicotianae TaxID=4792 RepID=W2QAP3_PHYN3|nr:hypothetical protein PPTG_10918 [Phytophthora nicotianae INRA-310]ETM47676.1 hypothetical protein L914_07667 [Phytophthora nicotianae]ETN10237.1 hypothetical protein PPTG_10918 [Phytophthora nicotianae INRA-310]ETO76658.1 hypothetical protein F444_07990 [Phytophthora nicotianae P1976]ETP45757.1 hypothetical protein F442_07884 [Phytophthora nicotianae P10297]